MSTSTCNDDGIFITQTSDEDLDYKLDWAPFLGLVDGDTIAESTWVVPDGLEQHDDDKTTTVTTVWIRGGVDGTEYAVVNHVTTTQGRIKDQIVTVTITDL